MNTSDPAIDAALAAAASSDWAVRSRAGQELARWADHPHVADVLARLLLDMRDTGVTVETCRAVLQRNDKHGIRLIAQAVATAKDPEHLDHLYDAVADHLLPDGPATQFRDICVILLNDPDPSTATATGAAELLRKAGPWSIGARAAFGPGSP